jgi:hypothetical protein
VIDFDLSEQLVVICDVFEHGAPEEGGKVYYAVGPVGESKAYDSVVHNIYVGYFDHEYSYGNGSIVPGG